MYPDRAVVSLVMINSLVIKNPYHLDYGGED